MSRALRPRSTRIAAIAGITALLSSCQGTDDPSSVIQRSIDTHGGQSFNRVHIQWNFRGVPFEVTLDDGRFRYQRTVEDSLGQPVVEVMENSGTWIEVDGQRQELDEESRSRLETAVNSVVYFGFLPFKLDDPPVQLADLGRDEVEGQPYRKIEVTFRQEGGGPDWEDRFVYWIHETDATLDYLAYREAAEVETTRFRKAVNRREIGGLLVQDYENYTGDPEVEDIADYDELFEAGTLRLVSMVEFDDLAVNQLE